MRFYHNSLIMHTYYKYRKAHTHIHIQTPTHLQKVLLTIYYSGCLVISSHHKSYQQYFDNLLNDKSLEKFIPIKKSKWNLQ